MAYDLKQTSFIISRHNYLLGAIYAGFVLVSVPIAINTVS